MRMEGLEEDAKPTIRFPVAHPDHDTVSIQPQQIASLIRRRRKKFPPERLPWFDQWLAARGPTLRSLVSTARDALGKHEKDNGARRRARREDDQRRYEIAVETVVANLAHSALFNVTDKRLAILTGNKPRGFTRYDNDALGKPLRRLLGDLEALGLVEWRWSPQRGVASSMAPTERLSAMVREAGITREDFGRQNSEEVILLSRKRKMGEWRDSRTERDWVNYTDTAETNAMRADMRRINAWLEDAAISFEDDGGEPVDVHDRTLRRMFMIHEGDPLEQRFDLSGRLYGGFWQNLKRKRRAGIGIDGEPVALLDYSSMFTRLAYASKGIEPPNGDLYAIPGLEQHRNAVKVGVNALLFARRTLGRWPSTEEDDQQPPAGWTMPRFRKALIDYHPAISDCFGTGLGYSLMHIESEIMVRVLTQLASEKVVALPLHDGMLVRRFDTAIGREVMEKVSKEVTSFILPVTESA